ncbi:MAG: hypothetical protein ABI577_01730 [bacterium]
MTEMIGAEVRSSPRDVSIAMLAWIGVGSLFVLIRLAGVLSIPVGGAELDHLAGAWQAHAGNGDERYLPTLFQGITSWTFSFTTSEAPARILVLLVSGTVPFALYRLRPVFGEVPALGALLLIALDPVSVLLGSTAWAGGWDLAIVLWLVVAMNESKLPNWAYAVVGFLLVTAGSLGLPLMLAAAGLRLFRQQYPPREPFAFAALGVIAGVAVATVGFGHGWEGPTIPPLATFSAGFDRPWATEHTRFVALLYSAPMIAGGLAAVASWAYRNWRAQDWPETDLLLMTWGAVALLWVVAAGGSHDPTPLAASAIPLALLIGLEVPAAIGALQRVDWRFALPVLAGIMLGAFVAEAYVVDWARLNSVGDANEKLIVTGLLIAVLACLGLLGSSRRTAGALIIPPGIASALILLSGATGIAFGGPNEPLPSPAAAVQGSEIRDIALAKRAQAGGDIVVHTSFAEELTWALRDSGDVELTSSVPADATVVIWPASEPAPVGFAIVDGQWSFEEERHGPDGGFLQYLRWLSDRNALKNSRIPVAVYLKAGQ